MKILFYFIAVIIIIFSGYSLGSKSVVYEYSYRGSNSLPPNNNDIINALGSDIYPQVLVGTLPKFARFILFEKFNIPWMNNYIPNFLNLDLRIIYDLFLKINKLNPMGGFILYRYNFTDIDNPVKIKKFINEINNKYSTKIILKNTTNNRKYEITIKPLITSDCVPNNVEAAYCRVFSKFFSIDDNPKDEILSAIEDYKIVTQYFKQLGMTSALGPSVDLNDVNNHNVHDLVRYAEEVSIEMSKLQQIPVLKHFCYDPKKADPHYYSYVDYRTIQDLNINDLMPYHAVDKLSIPYMIMTTHFLIDAIDSDFPATRSDKVVRYIRQNFKNALIITDEISMKGFHMNASFEDRVSMSRGDMFLVHSGLAFDIWSRRTQIYNGLKNRNISEMEVSINKILDLKNKIELIKIKEI